MKSALKLFIIGCLVLIFCRCSMNKDSYLKDPKIRKQSQWQSQLQ